MVQLSCSSAIQPDWLTVLDSSLSSRKMSKPYVERSASNRPVGKFIYHDDLRKFQGKKHAEELRKKEQETKRFKKAAMLRKYAKLCKAEGIQSDRVRIGERDKSEPAAVRPQKEKVEHRPFRRAEAQAARLEQAEKDKEAEMQEKLKQKEEAIRKREQKHRALSKTTKKGQPRLGNHMKVLLEKLQKN